MLTIRYYQRQAAESIGRQLSKREKQFAKSLNPCKNWEIYYMARKTSQR
jgi:hypothetical protein